MPRRGVCVRFGVAMWVACGASCAGGSNELLVYVRSDLDPGSGLRVSIPAEERTEYFVSSVGEDWSEGLLVAEFAELGGGPTRVDVEALKDGMPIVSRSVLVDVQGRTAVTVVLTRDCVGVVCPEAGDSADATACLGGHCVGEECTDGTQASCVPEARECSTDSDCPTSDCAAGSCLEGGVCIFGGNRCETGSFCVPELNECRMAGEVMPDTGVDAAVLDAGLDGGAMDSGFDSGATDTGIDSDMADVGADAGISDAETDTGAPDSGGGGCGDGTVDVGEDCDDNNQAGGDGCDSSCQVEPAWTCLPGSPSVCSPVSLVVDPVWPINGLNWNDYVRSDDAGVGIVQQDDEACTGAESGGPLACVHGGERRLVVLNGYSSCSGFSISDDLDVFRWRCEPSAGRVTFYSLGLKEDARLSDLLDPEGTWRANFVEVTRSGTTWSSAPEAWWTNPVTPDPPDGDLASGATGTIYFITASRNTTGYTLTSNRTALVVARGQKLTWNGTSDNCDDVTAKCVLQASNQRFLWIEGDVDAADDAYFALRWNNVDRSVLRSGWFGYTWDDGSNWSDGAVHLLNSDANRLQHLDVSWTIYSGLRLESSSSNELYDVTIAFTGVYGLSWGGSNANVFSRVSASSTWNEALYGGGFGNIGTECITIAGGSSGVIAMEGSTFSHITTMSGETGVYDGWVSPSNMTLVQAVSANHSTEGMWLENGPDRIVNLASGHNGGYGYVYIGHTDIAFDGRAWFGNNATGDCDDRGTASPGLLEPTCTPDPPLSPTVTLGVDMSGSFVGRVSSDALNQSDTNGRASFDSIAPQDWSRFDNRFRGWGRNAALGTAPSRGNCSAGTCAIWDVRLRASDSVLRGRNGSFTPGAACPATVNGNGPVSNGYVVSDYESRTFLANALEVMHDDIGNDNGLCESDEACIFSPNIGAYQGEGTLHAEPCMYTGSVVTGVTMYGYSQNGV